MDLARTERRWPWGRGHCAIRRLKTGVPQLGQGSQSRLSAVETDLKSLHHVPVCPDSPTTRSSLLWTRRKVQGSGPGCPCIALLGPSVHLRASDLLLSFGHLPVVADPCHLCQGSKGSKRPLSYHCQDCPALGSVASWDFLPTHGTPSLSPREFSLEGTSGRWQRFHLNCLMCLLLTRIL